ncbi:monocarboxylate transporter 12 [Bombyx mandarina]|uniref:Major facilitator superfamily (MFS) profile domain-containing protein n=2 Tax=Bombyx TaxID=7090 RepID=A0A8R2DNR1_BOMMO|nr:monocarboxylate transporter 12 [Bombyx mori]XP_021206869.1 monocarboxylate transporter 12 [Bombyx mori]XP_028032243.1 monocarboxylate transporter 12 [Bombyx mandarina]
MSLSASKNSKNENTEIEDSREGSESPAPPPDGGWGWMVVFASFMIHIVTDGMTYSFGVFYTEFLIYFQEGSYKTAWIVSILVGVTLSSGPISSSFVNRWGCQLVTVAGAILSSVCVVASAFAGNVLTLIFTIGVGAGFGFGLIYLPAIVSVTVWFERYRSLATGIAVCGSGLGTFLFAPITSVLISNYGWRGAMVIIGGLILNCIPLGLMFRPVPERPRTPVTEPMLQKQNKSPLKKSQSTEQIVRANGKTDNGDVARLTLSQPALNKHHEPKQPHSRHGSGIMNRPDVLYQGSMTSLARFRAPSPERVIAPAESKSILSEMLDFSLLVDPIFILFAISNFLTSIGFYIPYVYTVPMSKSMGIENPAFLISIIGASNLIGRIILGFISDKPWVNRLMAYNLSLTIAGISTAMAMICWEFWGLALYATVFGFTIGAYVGLTSVVLVDLLGLEKLTNAFGLLLLFQGVASLIGPPLAGRLYDATQSYGPAFYVAGGTISLSGLILFFIPMINRRQSNKQWGQATALQQI